MKKLILITATISFFTMGYNTMANDDIKGNGKITKETRTPGSFDAISSAGSFNIDIDQSGKEMIVVEADENVLPYIITEIEKGELKIHTKKGYNIQKATISVHVNCVKLHEINSAGSGNISTLSKLSAEKITIDHGGSGNCKMAFDVKELEINTAGSGNFQLSGNADELDISSAGSGNVNAKELKVVTAEISSAGSGDVVLQKGTKAKASAVGSGDISYE